MHPFIPRRPVPSVLLAGLVLAGCGGEGDHKVQRSSRPATVTAATPAKPKLTATGTFTGNDVLTKFGDVQVAVTLKHGRIVDVQWLKLPFDRERSQLISRQASPILRTEVLAAQSAQIDLLSGATYTSDGWANSVQSALAQAH
jgi:uncharacterized protein with FMN-binding domain